MPGIAHLRVQLVQSARVFCGRGLAPRRGRVPNFRGMPAAGSPSGLPAVSDAYGSETTAVDFRRKPPFALRHGIIAGSPALDSRFLKSTATGWNSTMATRFRSCWTSTRQAECGSKNLIDGFGNTPQLPTLRRRPALSPTAHGVRGAPSSKRVHNGEP